MLVNVNIRRNVYGKPNMHSARCGLSGKTKKYGGNDHDNKDS